jgi:predicted nuclease of restriction endonuclease-like RecB superfamily
VPHFLGPEDHPWLRLLLLELERCEGLRMREWRERAIEPHHEPALERRRRLALAVLSRICPTRPPESSLDPRSLRRDFFGLAAELRQQGRPLEEALEEESQRRGLSLEELREALYLDLPAERRICPLERLPDPPTLARLVNQHIAGSLLRSSTQVELLLQGRSRPLVRQILLRRLLATLHPRGEGLRIEVSGPMALFHHTTLYGRALTSLLPLLRHTDSFELLATCRLGDRDRVVQLGSGDPIFAVGLTSPAYDSQLEERFAQAFLKKAPDWDLLREPEPIALPGGWIFPDFALVHRRDGRRWLLEIVGFWTPSYLERKLQRIRQAGRLDLIVAIDQKLACSAEELPQGTQLLRYKNRLDPRAVLAILEARLPRREPALLDEVEISAPELFLDYAGRRPAEDPIHDALARLQPKQELRFAAVDQHLYIADARDQLLVPLSAVARASWRGRLERVVELRLGGVLERRAEQSAPEWRRLLRVPTWRVPLARVRLARA